MKQLLQQLAQTKLVKVTGSYADGTQTEFSDIDFYVKEDHPDYKLLGRTRNIEKIKAVLDEHGIKMESHTVGYWYSHKSDNPELSIQIEFSDLFRPRPNRMKEVTIYGVTFKTH